MAIADRKFSDLKVGETASFEAQISQEEMDAFSRITGDVNPLHTDDAYAATTPFGRRVVYGQLLNAFFSRLIGHYLPGKRALYVTQTSTFVAPCFVNDRIRVSGRISALHESVKLLEIETEIHRLPGEELVVSGKATAMVL